MTISSQGWRVPAALRFMAATHHREKRGDLTTESSELRGKMQVYDERTSGNGIARRECTTE
jgi:hypothetical protein